jgi:hypothetical protein
MKSRIKSLSNLEKMHYKFRKKKLIEASQTQEELHGLSYFR